MPRRSYRTQKEAMGIREAEVSRLGREIGPVPEVVNPERRENCREDFREFCERYFPQTFELAWSEDHLRVIGKTEQAVLKGGLFAMACSRGFGKTSIACCACLWALLYGHREFVCLIGSDEGHALLLLDLLKTELENNELLLADFPEVCFPIRALEGIPHRCNGQLCEGRRTRIAWTSKELVLPTIPGSEASGGIVRVAGITGRIRGLIYKRHDGRTVRPSLVLVDDPQTDESARSPSQSAGREAILAGAVLGLAGPGKKISGIMPCTVIRPGDMADKILDRDKHPEWNGERTKLIYSFPTNRKLWDEYAEIRAESLRAGKGITRATEFYAANRAEMDRGARAAWPERFNVDEISAVQHAMNLRLQDESAFFAEYQNEPLSDESEDGGLLTGDEIAAKTNGMRRGLVPISASRLTAYLDVQQKLLFYVVCAWEDDFTGYVLDYGTYPEQKRHYFQLREIRGGLASATRGAGVEGSIYAGLEKLTDKLLATPWQRDDGSELSIERCIIDANWGQSTDVVYQFCRQSVHSAVLLPSHGRYVGAASKPMSEYRSIPGERTGLNWRIPNRKGKRSVRHLLYDTNFWKSFVHARLSVAMGDKGCLSLFGRDTNRHRLFSEHLTAEYRVRTEGRGRTVDEWKVKPERADNHWFDCLVGCAVSASVQGVDLLGAKATQKVKRERIKLSELQRRKRL